MLEQVAAHSYYYGHAPESRTNASHPKGTPDKIGNCNVPCGNREFPTGNANASQSPQICTRIAVTGRRQHFTANAAGSCSACIQKGGISNAHVSIKSQWVPRVQLPRLRFPPPGTQPAAKIATDPRPDLRVPINASAAPTLAQRRWRIDTLTQKPQANKPHHT